MLCMHIYILTIRIMGVRLWVFYVAVHKFRILVPERCMSCELLWKKCTYIAINAFWMELKNAEQSVCVGKRMIEGNEISYAIHIVYYPHVTRSQHGLGGATAGYKHTAVPWDCNHGILHMPRVKLSRNIIHTYSVRSAMRFFFCVRLHCCGH